MTFPSEHTLDEAGLHVDLGVPGLMTITLSKPERRNAQTPQMWRALTAIGAHRPDDVRVVILQGAGDCFSAGLDLALLSPEGIEGETFIGDVVQDGETAVSDLIAGYQDAFRWWHDPAVVTIAAVHGYAIGAGFQLALACDLRVVADDTRFCMKEPALGLVPDLLGTKPLVELVGYSRALEICATARFVDADESRDLGLATVVVPRAELQETAADLAAAILGHDADAVSRTKALLQGARARSLDDQGREERRAQYHRFRALLGAGPDHAAPEVPTP